MIRPCVWSVKRSIPSCIPRYSDSFTFKSVAYSAAALNIFYLGASILLRFMPCLFFFCGPIYQNWLSTDFSPRPPLVVAYLYNSSAVSEGLSDQHFVNIYARDYARSECTKYIIVHLLHFLISSAQYNYNAPISLASHSVLKIVPTTPMLNDAWAPWFLVKPA